MTRKLCPKLILEGTRLTLKTEIAFALNEHPRLMGARKYRYRAPLVSAEWGAFTTYPRGRGLINFDPDEEALAMETYRTWMRLFELQRYYSWVVDRFHLSTRVYQRRAHGRDYDFRWLEERLLDVGFHLVLCTRSTESFEAARAQRLLVSGKPEQYDDLSLFIDEQEGFRELAGQSILPVLDVDVSGNDATRAADRITEWLFETGGVWAS